MKICKLVVGMLQNGTRQSRADLGAEDFVDKMWIGAIVEPRVPGNAERIFTLAFVRHHQSYLSITFCPYIPEVTRS